MPSAGRVPIHAVSMWPSPERCYFETGQRLVSDSGCSRGSGVARTFGRRCSPATENIQAVRDGQSVAQRTCVGDLPAFQVRMRCTMWHRTGFPNNPSQNLGIECVSR
jgi:hypothetical protein